MEIKQVGKILFPSKIDILGLIYEIKMQSFCVILTFCFMLTIFLLICVDSSDREMLCHKITNFRFLFCKIYNIYIMQFA